MPSKNSKIVSARVPEYMEFKIPISRILSSVYAGLKDGKIGVNPKGLIFESDCEKCDRGKPQISESVNTYDYEDPDGEWVRDMAHELNMDVKTFKRRIEQAVVR